MSQISAAARRELVESVGARYRSALADDKRRILDVFVAVTGYHRKHAIRILNALDGETRQRRGGRRPLYDEAVRQALIILWEESDRICGSGNEQADLIDRHVITPVVRKASARTRWRHRTILTAGNMAPQ